MKLDFAPPRDNKVHTYCMDCKREEGVLAGVWRGKPEYVCTCGHRDVRALIIDPQVKWWVAGNGEYWHATAGIFVVNANKEFLFFERTKYPPGLTVPAGHVDVGETTKRTALRELREETNIQKKPSQLAFVGTKAIKGDGCRRGSDAHKWHVFATTAGDKPVVIDKKEGSNPVWLTLDEALRRDLTFATRYVISRYANKILQAVK